MIDLAALADEYRERLRREQQAMTPLLVALVLAVQQLDKASKQLDQVTARWPILLHRDDALAVWVAVPPGVVPKGPSFLEALEANAKKSVEGVALVTSAWEQAWALYRVTSTLAAMARGALASVEKYRAPTPSELFDPAGKSAGDLIGQTALVLRTALADPQAISRAGVRARVALWILELARRPAEAEPPPAESLPETLVKVVEAQVALLFVLPGVGTLVAALRVSVDHKVRTEVLAHCVAIESDLYNMREKTLRKLVPGNAISEYLYAADWVLRHNIVMVCAWLPLAVELFLLWVELSLRIATDKGKKFAKWFMIVMTGKEIAAILASPAGTVLYNLLGGLPGPDFSKVTLPPFPEVDPSILDKSLEKQIIGELHKVRDTAVTAVTTAADAATKAFQDAGAVAAGLGPTLARTARIDVLAAQAEKHTAAVFGEELEAAAATPERQPFAAMSRAMEQHVLTAGGFELVGRLIPSFLAEAGRTWQDIGAVPSPTSPHILARHGRLAGVRVPEVTVRVGRGPESQDAQEIATRLRAVMVDAYRAGREKFDALAASGGP